MQMLSTIDLGAATALVGYIGPGPGLSMLGALIGLIATVVAALGAVLLWPIRALLGNLDDESEEGAPESDGSDEGEGDHSRSDAEDDPDLAAGAAEGSADSGTREAASADQ